MAVISIGRLSGAQAESRFDAEFFDPADLALIKSLSQEGAQALGSICEVLNGRTPDDYFPDGDVPIVRSGDLVAPFIYPGCSHDFLRARSNPRLVPLQKGDVLVSSIGMGSIGKISLVMDAATFATVSEVTILRSKGYPPEVLFAYLTTEAGQRQILRQITGATGQQHLLKTKVETILVPKLPAKHIGEAVAAACQKAWALEKEAAAALETAHATFAKATGLKLL
jgi:type I restriction enzyme S subunit